jgi:hypothetical protein
MDRIDLKILGCLQEDAMMPVAFFDDFGLATSLYSEKLFAGTKHLDSGFSHPRKCGELLDFKTLSWARCIKIFLNKPLRDTRGSPDKFSNWRTVYPRPPPCRFEKR